MNENISLSGLDKLDVLLVLYNAAKPITEAAVQAVDNTLKMHAAELIARNDKKFLIVDLGSGPRILNIDLSTNEFNPREYDKVNGPGQAEKAIAAWRVELRSRLSVTTTGSPSMLPSSPAGSPVSGFVESPPGSPTLSVDRPTSLELPPPAQLAPVHVAQQASQHAPQHTPQHSAQEAVTPPWFSRILHPTNSIPRKYTR